MIEELLWGFADLVPRKREVLNPKPVVPKTNWKRPTIMPSLRGCSEVGIDLETWDPNLKKLGPGWARGDGYIVGVSVTTDDGFSAYYPIRHEEEAHDNFEPHQVLRWLNQELCHNNLKVGHNLAYDVGWLKHEGAVVRGPLWDTQTAESLIRHQAEVNLEATAQRRVGGGKSSEDLYRWLHAYFGKEKNPTPDQLRDSIKWIKFAPPRLAAEYAESDTALPLAIRKVQIPILEELGLMDLFWMETKLILLMTEMRMAGVSVDIPSAEAADVRLTAAMEEIQAQVNHLAGTDLNTGSPMEVGRVFDRLNIRYPRTPSNNQPCIKEDFLETVEHPIAQRIIELQNLKKTRNTFVRGFILDSHVGGRIFPTHNTMRAITGRMSCEKPNTQQIPSRNHLAKAIRAIFVPDTGHHHIRKYDYASVEARILGHFAVGPGSDELRAAYNANPFLDTHQWNQDTIKQKSGVLMDRKDVKGIAFCRMFGGGKGKQAAMLGMSVTDAEPLFQAFDDGLPYIPSTIDHFSRMVHSSGETRTVLGRRVEFSKWEPMNTAYGEKRPPALEFEAALAKYGTRVKRAYSHKAINYTIQGSAADLMKSALVQCYESGVFGVTTVPRMIVHDEKVFSVPDDTVEIRAAFTEMKRIMEEAIPFRVPIKAEGEWGENWGVTYKLDH